MKRKAVLILAIALGLALTLGVFAGLTLAGGGVRAPADVTGPTVISYQGQVLVDGEPYTGTGYFKFAVVNAAGNVTFWSNDGSSTVGDEPAAAVDLPVADGVFSVLLGNPLESNMTEPLGAGVFADRGRRLHVWFSTDMGGPYTDLGTTIVAAVPYALNAETLDGMDGSYYDQHYDNLIVVAESGGDYTSIQSAVDSISDNDEFNRYLIWVAPGIYSETVTLKPYVSLQGAGAGTTVLLSFAASGSLPPGSTLEMTEYTSLRDMTVVVTGTGYLKAAVYLGNVVTDTVIIADAVVQAHGEDYVYGIYNYYASPLILDTSISAWGITRTEGIRNFYCEPTIWNVTVHAEAEEDGYGIYNDHYVGDGPVIRDTIASGRSVADDGIGIYNWNAVSTVRDTVASGEGPDDGYGIYSYTATDPYTTTIDSCQLSGNIFALLAVNSANRMYVGSSLLDGGAAGAGTYYCAFSYDGDYNELDSDCQPLP